MILRACAFCAADHTAIYQSPAPPSPTGEPLIAVVCLNCRARGPWEGSIVEAEEAWNRRELEESVR